MPVDPAQILALRPTILDQQQLQAAFQQKQQQAVLESLKQTSGQNLPAPIQIANEIARRRQAGDVDGANLLAESAKIFDKGIQVDPTTGQMTTIGGYAPAVASIEGAKSGAKEQAQMNVDMVAKPIIAGGEAQARNASELNFAAPIRTAQTTAENNAKLQNTVNTRGQQAGNSISVIDQILTPDVNNKTVLDRATGSTLGALAASGDKLIGRSTDATRANAQLNVLGGQLLNNVPRMEGPQSDRDVESYREQAGKIADPSIPANDKKAALQIIKSLSAKYATMNESGVASLPPGSALPDINANSPALHMSNAIDPPGNEPSAPQSGPIRVSSPQEAAQLPSGTQFVTPDGKIRIKH